MIRFVNRPSEAVVPVSTANGLPSPFYALGLTGSAISRRVGVFKLKASEDPSLQKKIADLKSIMEI